MSSNETRDIYHRFRMRSGVNYTLLNRVPYALNCVILRKAQLHFDFNQIPLHREISELGFRVYIYCSSIVKLSDERRKTAYMRNAGKPFRLLDQTSMNFKSN